MAGGVWQAGAAPSAIWNGDLADADYPHSPIELEIYTGDSGVLRTVYGWFPVTGYRPTPSALSFDVDGANEVAPNSLDAKVIQRASEILSSTAVWNRSDNRQCPGGAKTFSIYCAAMKAVEEVTGGSGPIDHRRPAMEVIRGVVDDRSKGRDYQHRLMDYNNDPTTTLADVQSLFRDALRVMVDDAWLGSHGFLVKGLETKEPHGHSQP